MSNHVSKFITPCHAYIVHESSLIVASCMFHNCGGEHVAFELLHFVHAHFDMCRTRVIEIIYKIVGFRWGNMSHLRHASVDFKWKKCNYIQLSADMLKILDVLVVVDQAKFLELTPCLLHQVVETFLDFSYSR